MCVFHDRPAKDYKKRPLQKAEGKQAKQQPGPMFGKRHNESKKRENETDKISERRKNPQTELVALESHNVRLACHLYATMCFSAHVHMTLGKVVPTPIVLTIICDVMPAAPAPGFSEFFAL